MRNKLGDLEFSINKRNYGIYKLLFTNESWWVYERTDKGRLVCYELFKGKRGNLIPSSDSWGRNAFSVLFLSHIKKYIQDFDESAISSVVFPSKNHLSPHD